MGFYGNITKINSSPLVFDKIYASRGAMDSAAETDGVFVGRYVIIEYSSSNENGYTCLYEEEDNVGVCYTSLINMADSIYTGDFEKNNIYVIKTLDVNEEVVKITYKVYNDTTYTSYELAANATEEDFYSLNKKIDNFMYTNTENYNSTVWMKIFKDGKEQYTKIASLSVDINFDMRIIAPTLFPKLSVIEKNENNLELDVQPTWGFRVAVADKEDKLQIHTISFNGNDEIENDTGDTINVTDKDISSNYSDEDISWKFDYNGNSYSYNSDNQAWEKSSSPSTLPAAIYYNKAGFDSETETTVNLDDTINIEPTGYSGNLYNGVVAPDIQELSMMLPSIGNSISKMWNVVYGEGNSVNYNQRNTDIAWEDPSIGIYRKGLRLNDGTNNTDAVNTLAGSINTAHDLIGMIIVPIDNINNLEPRDANENYIYYDETTQKYYYKAKEGNDENTLVPCEQYDEFNPIYIIIDSILLEDEEIISSALGSFILGESKLGVSDDGETIEKRIVLSKETNKWYLEDKIYKKEVENSYEHDRTYYYIIPQEKVYLKVFDYNNWYYYDEDEKTYRIATNDDRNDITHLWKSKKYKMQDDRIIFIPNRYYKVEKANDTITELILSDTLEDNSTYIYLSQNDIIDNAIKDVWIKNNSNYDRLTSEIFDLDKLLKNKTEDDFKTSDKFYGTFKNSDDGLVFTLNDNFTTGDSNKDLIYKQYYTNGIYYLEEDDNNKYYYKQFTSIDEYNINSDNFYIFDKGEQRLSHDSYYEPNTYYCCDEDGNYYVDSSSEPQEDVTYYNSIEVKTFENTVEANQPYYLYNDTSHSYVIKEESGAIHNISDNDFLEGVKVVSGYLGTWPDGDLYVVSKDSDKYAFGSEWNRSLTLPEGLQVGYYRTIYIWKELELGTEESLNSSILKFNQLINTNNKDSRDKATLQGCLNVLNDYINLFDVYIDEGRLSDTDYNGLYTIYDEDEEPEDVTYGGKYSVY